MGDYFSVQAADYSRYRPDYPPALYELLMPFVQERHLAWDCGTGNGQVAAVLATYFQQVIATDLSAAQLAEARPVSNIEFAVASAEQSGLDAHIVDLITVAQAIHWFEHERFWQECIRVAKPGALLAFWTYGLADAGLPDNFEQVYHSDIVGPYWPPGREHVDCLYASIKPPFALLLEQTLSLDLSWSQVHYLGYLSSWSATQRYRRARGQDPLESAQQKLAEIWGAGLRDISWPLVLKIYAIN